MSVFFTRRGGAPAPAGKLASDYAVGESVFLNVNGKETEFLVVQQGKPSSAIYDSSCDGVWLLMKDVYENRVWDNSYKYYANSAIHTYLNGTFLALLDPKVQQNIKQATIRYFPGTYSPYYSDMFAKVFLLDAREIGLRDADQTYLGENGAKLAYFNSGTGDAANNKRIAYLNGNASYWWTRSGYTHSGTIGYAWFVRQDGLVGGFSTSNSFGVRPAFILSPDTKFDPDTNNVL